MTARSVDASRPTMRGLGGVAVAEGHGDRAAVDAAAEMTWLLVRIVAVGRHDHARPLVACRRWPSTLIDTTLGCTAAATLASVSVGLVPPVDDGAARRPWVVLVAVAVQRDLRPGQPGTQRHGEHEGADARPAGRTSAARPRRRSAGGCRWRRGCGSTWVGACVAGSAATTRATGRTGTVAGRWWGSCRRSWEHHRPHGWRLPGRSL